MPKNIQSRTRIGRRQFLRMAAFGSAAGLTILKSARGQVVSPPTRPFITPLTIPPVLQPVSTLSGPVPLGSNHQRGTEFWPPVLHEIRVRPAPHSFHPDLPTNTIWGYNGIFPGPTWIGRYGRPMLMRIFCHLPKNHVGFGIPQVSTHLHNSHSASESDGFPGNYHGPGQYRDHHYPLFPAGNDIRETLGTLWYHDHRLDFTAPNVYRGLAGFCLLFDHIDSGNENDPSPTALRLPSGPYDIPLILADKQFDSQGQVYFDQFNTDGLLGDKFTVNGKIQPYFKVARRKYRFRILDGGPSRIYQVGLSSGHPMVQIANDGNLFPRPLVVSSVLLGVAERKDVIIDFRNFNVGDSVYLENRMVQTNGRGPDGQTGEVLPAGSGTPLLRFDIDRDAPDPSVIPDFMRELPPINLAEVRTTRRWEFARSGGAWTINGRIFSLDEVRAAIPQGSAEIWELQGAGNWWHPIHIHFEEFQILSRNGLPPPPDEVSRKDVVLLRPGELVRVFMRFRDFLGRYPMHCHNTIHEDHAMMLRWDIVP